MGNREKHSLGLFGGNVSFKEVLLLLPSVVSLMVLTYLSHYRIPSVPVLQVVSAASLWWCVCLKMVT